MKLIIDIDEDYFDLIQLSAMNGMGDHLHKIVAQGTPLPKGHGDLIDRNECLKLKMTDLYDKDGVTMYAVPTGNILRMKPIIEADTPKREEGTPLEENDSGYNCENWIP